MKKRFLLLSGVLTLSVLFAFALVNAQQQAADTITMNSPVYGKHTKTSVKFSHKKHAEDYGVACNECHHLFEGGKNVWKEGDAVQKCQECHKEAKAPPPKKGAPKISAKEMIKTYHYSAIHENCVACHKELKKKDRQKYAKIPVTCANCHPVPKKK